MVIDESLARVELAACLRPNLENIGPLDGGAASDIGGNSKRLLVGKHVGIETRDVAELSNRRFYRILAFLFGGCELISNLI